MSSQSTQLALVVDSLGGEALRGRWLRHQAAGWRYSAPGAGARTVGGRWNPPQSFATLYLAESEQVAEAELKRLARKAGTAVADMLPRDLLTYEIELIDVVDLTAQEAQEAVGLSSSGSELVPLKRCQQIGATAHHLGREAVLAPSAAGRGRILAIFLERLGADSRCELVETSEWSMGQ